MRNKQSMELLLEIKTSNTDMKKVVESTVKSMDSLSAGITKNLEQVTRAFGSSMMGVTNQTDAAFKDIAKTLGMITDLLAQIQDKPRAARNAGDARKLNTSVKLKGVEGVQKGILGRAQTSYRQAVGLEGYTGATEVMEKFAAMNSLLSTKIKGAGNLKDDLGAAQAMRSFTKLDREVGRLFIGSDFSRALGKAGNVASQAQKRATQALVTQVRTAMGTGDAIFDDMAKMALTGTTDTDMKQWATNIKNLGRSELRKMGRTISPNKYAKDYSKSLKMMMGEISSAGTNDDMQKFLKQFSINMPAEPAGEMSASQRKAFNKQRNAAIYKAAQLQSSMRVDNEYRTFGEQALYSRANSAIMRMPDMQEFEAAGPQQVRTGIKGLFDKVAGAFKKSEKHVGERSGEAEAAMMRGFDAFGYRMITISYMLSNTNMILSNVINELMSAGVSRQQAMGKIQPILSGGVSSSGEELSPYRKEMESIAAETGIGFDALAQSMYDTASAFPNVANKMDALRVTAKLTSVGFGGTTASMEGLIAVAKTYNRDLETDSAAFSAAMETLGDLSVAAANVGTLEVSELGDAMQTMAPTAANLGITIRELYASIASTAGVIGNTSEAANKLKQLFTAFNSPNTKMQEFYKTEGVANGAALFRKYGGIQGAMGAVEKYIGPAGNYKTLTGRSQAQEAIFGLSNADDLFKAFVDMKSTLLELENATWKATHGVAYWSTEYAASTERYKTIQTEVGESLLPFKVGIQNVTNAILGLAMDLNPFMKTFIPTIFQVTATLSGIITPFIGFAGAIALATRALSQMSGEVMSGKSVEMFLKNIGDKADHIQASDYTTVATNLGRNTVYKTGFVDSKGKMRMDQNVGSATGLNTGGAMAVLGKIALGVTALVAVVAIASAISTMVKNAARKKGDEAMGSSSVIANQTRFSELAQDVINRIEKSYTTPEIVLAKTMGDKLAETITSAAATNDAAIAAMKKLGPMAGDYAHEQAQALLSSMKEGKYGVAAKELGNKYGDFMSKDEMADAITQLTHESSMFESLAKSIYGARPNNTKDVVEAIASDDLDKSMRESIRGIFSNIILDAKDVISPFNYQDAAGTAAKKLAEDERDRIIKGGGTTAEGTAGYESTIKKWDAMFKTFSAYAGWSAENLKYLKIKGVKDREGSVPSEVASLTGALDVMREVMAKTTVNAGKFGDDLSTSGAIGNALMVVESALEKVSESALAADENFAGLSDELNKFRRNAAIESMVNADKMNQRTIRSVSGQFNNPSQQAQAYATLMSAMNGDSTPEALEKALLGLSGKTDTYSRMTGPGIASVSSMGGNRGLLSALGGILNDQGDIANVARALSSTGIMIGEGADRMSAAAFFLSGAANMTEKTFMDLANQFDLTTPADAALYTELIRGFDVFAIAAQTAADALNDNKNSFLRPGQQDAISLRRQASELRQQYQPGSAFYDPGVAGNPSAIASVDALADRLEKQAKVQSALSGFEGNPLESFNLQGGGFDIANIIPGFLVKAFTGTIGAVKGGIGMAKKIGEWGTTPKRQWEVIGTERGYEHPESLSYDKWGQPTPGKGGYKDTPYMGWSAPKFAIGTGKNEGEERLFSGRTMLKNTGDFFGKIGGGIGKAAEFMFNKDEVDRTAAANGNPGAYTTGFGAMVKEGFTGFFAKREDGTSKAGDVGENILGGALAGLGSFVTMLMSSVSSLKSVQMILNPLKIIFDSMMKVLAPVIDQVLAPLIGIFVIIGELLGQLLVPILLAFMPVIMAVVEIFVMLYNMLLPVFEFILDIFSLFGVVMNNMVITIMAAVSKITFWDDSDDHWQSKNKEDIGTAWKRLTDEATLQKIEIGQVQSVGASAIAGDDSSSGANGSSADTAKAPEQHFNFYIGADVITDVQGGKIVSMDYMISEMQRRMAETVALQA